MSDDKQRDLDHFVQEVVNRVFHKHTDDNSFEEQVDGGGYWRSEPNLTIDRGSLKGLFYKSDWVYILNNLIATKISNQHLSVFQEIMVDGEIISKPARDHELQSLLDRPNEHQSQTTFIYNWVVDLTLGGNGLVYHPQLLDSMHNIPFERVNPIIRPNSDERLGYSVSRDPDCEPNATNSTIFSPDEIIHAMKPNPSSCWWGLSPFIPGKSAVLFSKYSQEFLNSFYLKGATPQLALEMDSDVNERGAIRMLRSFEKAYGGRENQRRPIITPKGVTAKPLTTTLADQQLITYINNNRETLMNLLSIPKHELSLQDGGGLGSQEMRLSLRNFWLTTLKPTMGFIEGPLNIHFAERLQPNYKIRFDLAGVEALQDDEIKKAELADRLIKAGVWTPNEARSRIFKMGFHPDGDALMGAMGRGAQVEPPPAIPPGERPSDGEPIRALLDSRTKEAASSLQKQREVAEERPKSAMEQLAVSVFAKYLDVLLGLLKESLGDLFPDTDEEPIKSAENPTPKELDAALKKLNKKLKAEMKEVATNYSEQYRDINGPTAEAGHANVISASFSPDTAADIFALRNQSTRRLLLQARGFQSFDLLNKTSTEQVMTRIAEGFKNNDSLQQVTRSIVNKFDEGSEFRAQRIARTEVGMATMLGREAAFRDAKEVIGDDVKKVWLSAGDDDVRNGENDNGDHAMLNNTQADKSGVWETSSGESIRYPLDPDVRPQDRINCRCDMIFVEDL